MGPKSGATDVCSAYVIGHSGQYTAEQLQQFGAGPAEKLEQVVRDVEPALQRVEFLRAVYTRAQADMRKLNGSPKATPAAKARVQATIDRAKAALDKAAVPVEADIAARLQRDVPGARDVIEKVRTEALADRKDSDGPQRDTDAWVNNHWVPNVVTNFFRWECAGNNYDASLAARSEESQASTTMYQRLRSAYDRLRPRITEDERLPFTPFNTPTDE